MNTESFYKQLNELIQNQEYDQLEGFMLKSLSDSGEQKEYSSYITIGNELVGLYRNMKQFSKAFQIAEDVLLLLEELQQEESESFILTLLNAAGAYQEAGMMKQSYDFTLRSQKIAEGLYEENDLRHIPILQQLGTLLLGRKDYEQAAVVLKRVFQVFSSKEDSSAGNAPDPNYAAVLLLLGECFYQMDDFLQSADYYEKAAAYIKDYYGETESYAMVLNNLTAVYQRCQNEAKAMEYQKKSNEVLKACAKE